MFATLLERFPWLGDPRYPDYFSCYSRPLDFTYPSNRLIMMFTLSVLGTALLIGVLAGGLVEALWQAIHFAAGVFIAWIFARELDPDHLTTSYIAPVGVLVGLIALGWEANLIALVVPIISVRCLNRVTGLPPMLFDLCTLVVLVVWAAAVGVWSIGLMVSFVFLLETKLPEASPWAMPAAALFVILPLVAADVMDTLHFDIEFLAGVGLLLLLAWYRWLLPKMPVQFTSHTDHFDKPLVRGRILGGQLILMIAVGWVAFWQGWQGLEAIFPLAGAVISFLGYQTWINR